MASQARAFGEMALSRPRWTREQYVLGAVQKGAGGQLLHQRAVDLGAAAKSNWARVFPGSTPASATRPAPVLVPALEAHGICSE